MITTREQAADFATQWAEAWNRLDLDFVLEHFAEDVVFSSPKALAAVGTGTVRGKDALRHYWRVALEAITTLRFDVVRVIWDPATSELAIIYDREVNDRRDRAAEILQFGAGGRVVRGEVFYGVSETSGA
jgi:ketosteroid isomerase-like protein